MCTLHAINSLKWKTFRRFPWVLEWKIDAKLSKCYKKVDSGCLYMWKHMTPSVNEYRSPLTSAKLSRKPFIVGSTEYRGEIQTGAKELTLWICEWFSVFSYFEPKIPFFSHPKECFSNEFEMNSKWSRNKIEFCFFFNSVTNWKICLIYSIFSIEWAKKKIGQMQIILSLWLSAHKSIVILLCNQFNFIGKSTHSMRRIERGTTENKSD